MDKETFHLRNSGFPGEKEWFFLFWIAYLKFNLKTAITTPDICRHLEASQQTVSRRIIELEQKGYLTRDYQGRAGELNLTPEGYLQLTNVFKNLQSIFNNHLCFDSFKGILKTGFGEGASYIKNPKYLVQFEEKLGFKPFFGTLNVHLNPQFLIALEEQMKNCQEIIIDGFRDEQRAYGEVRIIKVEIWGKNERHRRVPGGLLRIQRTSHDPHMLEFIAEKFLRDYFHLQDGDEINFAI